MHMRAMAHGARLAGDSALADNLSDAAFEVSMARAECVENSPLGWTILRPDAELREMGL